MCQELHIFAFVYMYVFGCKLSIIIIIIIVIIITAIDFSLDGSSPYTSTDKRSRYKYT
jgi:hypothetical protein